MDAAELPLPPAFSQPMENSAISVLQNHLLPLAALYDFGQGPFPALDLVRLGVSSVVRVVCESIVLSLSFARAF